MKTCKKKCQNCFSRDPWSSTIDAARRSRRRWSSAPWRTWRESVLTIARLSDMNFTAPHMFSKFETHQAAIIVQTFLPTSRQCSLKMFKVAFQTWYLARFKEGVTQGQHYRRDIAGCNLSFPDMLCRRSSLRAANLFLGKRQLTAMILRVRTEHFSVYLHLP